jgi:CBS domain-containing protein
MLPYKAIEIFTSELTRCQGKPVAESVIQYVRSLKIAARCVVTKGIAGCYESGEVATGRMEILSYNLPVRIYIVLPAAECERVLAGLDGLVSDGIIALHDLQVVGHRARNAFFPRQLRVRDAMTAGPQCVTAASPLSEAARLLLSSIFTGLPVVDDQNRPMGVITQGDLIQRGHMPLRLGLLAESDQDRRQAVLAQLANLRADEVMTAPAVTIGEDQPLAEAVDLMLERQVKRLPVVDEGGRLTGMLSRLDVFRTVMREAPDWNAFRAQKIEVAHLRSIGDILRRDTHKVFEDTPIDEVIRTIDHSDIQRVAVVDAQGKLLGVISDRDLLRYFKQDQEGIWGVLAKVKSGFRPNAGRGDFTRAIAATRAAQVMRTDLITVRESHTVEEAITLMIEKELKRLPVVDDDGRFKGMISRDSLLRTGFGAVG